MTIKQLPKRVVAIGGGDMETAISLGVDPVIGADWFGYTKTRSWVKKALKGAPAPELVGTTQLPYEKIAAANPDLILYVNSLNDAAVYHKLAEIAPTIAASASVKNAYGVPWPDQLATIAKATGTTQRARTVLADTNAIIDKAKKENPEFQGKTITAGVFTNNSTSVWFPSDPRMQLLQQLGFKVNRQISKLDNGSFYVTLSDEQLQLMNADLIFLAARDAAGKVVKAVTDNKVFHALSTVRAGHVAYWPGPGVVNTNTEGGEFSSALSIGGPLGIAYSVPKLIPMLRGALESKKATE
jgi:iron complex transport system substrate-binding protein